LHNPNNKQRIKTNKYQIIQNIKNRQEGAGALSRRTGAGRTPVRSVQRQGFGCPASSRGRLTEDDARRLAHEKYDRFLERMDAKEAAAPERERRAEIARQLEANAEAIRQAHLAASRPRTTRVVRATQKDQAGGRGDASSSLSSSSYSGEDDDDSNEQ
jgi:hypothetical protein